MLLLLTWHKADSDHEAVGALESGRHLGDAILLDVELREGVGPGVLLGEGVLLVVFPHVGALLGPLVRNEALPCVALLRGVHQGDLPRERVLLGALEGGEHGPQASDGGHAGHQRLAEGVDA